MDRAAWTARPALAAVFAVGVLLTAGGMVVGLAVAFGTDGRPPRVALTEELTEDLVAISRRIEAGEFDRAIAELEIAHKLLFTERPRIETLLGRAHRAAGRLPEATEHLRRAIALDPGLAEARHELALAYADGGLLDDALGELRESIQLDPQSESARRNLAVLERRIAAKGAAREAELPPPSGPHAADIAEARSILLLFYRGELDVVRARFSPGLARRISIEEFNDMRLKVARQLGPEREMLEESATRRPNGSIYVRRARFDRHSDDVEVVVELTADKSIDALEFRPAAPR
jgi:tetratricopeptide (TPR) repeat protein